MQRKLADRSVNPNVGDVNQLCKKWGQEQMGEDDGKELLERLQCEIEVYYEKWGKEGGKAALKLVEADLPNCDSGSDTEDPTPPKYKRGKKGACQSLVIAICTTLMARVHQNVIQSAEVLYCDSTVSLDRFNTPVYCLQARLQEEFQSG